MTAPGPRLGNGTMIELLTTGFEAEVTKFEWPEMGVRTDHPTSTIGTGASYPTTNKHGNATFIPGKLVDPGMWKTELHFAPAMLTLLKSGKQRGRLTLALLDGETTATKYEVDVYARKVGGPTVEPDGLLKQEVEFKLSGEITETPAT